MNNNNINAISGNANVKRPDKSGIPPLEDLVRGLGGDVSALSRVKPPEPVTQTHTLFLTENSSEQLITSIQERITHTDHIVVGVTSNPMIDEVKTLLQSAGLTADKKISTSIYETEGYLHWKHFKVPYEYPENTPPWALPGEKSEIDAEQEKLVAASPKWKLKKEIAKKPHPVFPRRYANDINIVIMTNACIFDPNVRSQMGDQNTSLIMFNPGPGDFQNFYRKMEVGEDGKKIKTFKERPEDRRYPVLLEYMHVDYILESRLTDVLIKFSYDQYKKDNLEYQECPRKTRHHNIMLFTSKMASKKHSGTMPIAFEIMNELSFDRRAVLVGDGMSTPQNFSNLRTGIEVIDAPTVVRLSQPSPEMIDNLGKQIGHEFADMKRAIVVDCALSVLRRVRDGQDIYFVVEKKLPKWLKEGIPAFSDIDVIRTPDRNLPDSNPVSDMLQHYQKEVVKITRAKKALKYWINKNKIRGRNLEKLIVNLMVTVTLDIRAGFNRKRAAPEFKFTERVADRVKVSEWEYQRVIQLVDSIMESHVKTDDVRKSIFKRYREPRYIGRAKS